MQIAMDAAVNTVAHDMVAIIHAYVAFPVLVELYNNEKELRLSIIYAIFVHIFKSHTFNRTRLTLCVECLRVHCLLSSSLASSILLAVS